MKSFFTIFLCTLIFFPRVYAIDSGFSDQAQFIDGLNSDEYRFVDVPNQSLKIRVYYKADSGWFAPIIDAYLKPVKMVFADAGIEINVLSIEEVEVSGEMKTSTREYFDYVFNTISKNKINFSDQVLNLFFTDSISVDGYQTAQGLSDGIPGKSFCKPICKTGVVITTPLSSESGKEDIIRKVVSMTHEIGHFLGLFHTKGSFEELGLLQAGFTTSKDHAEHFIMDTQRNFSPDFAIPSFSVRQALIMSQHPLIQNNME